MIYQTEPSLGQTLAVSPGMLRSPSPILLYVHSRSLTAADAFSKHSLDGDLLHGLETIVTFNVTSAAPRGSPR